MRDFRSDDEFLAALRAFIDKLCDERRYDALARVLPGYLAFNGMTDGWGELRNALKSTRTLGHEAFNGADWAVLNELIHATDHALNCR